MERNDDLSLLELKLLAQKHKTSDRYRSLEEKRMIVRAHLVDHVPISQLAKQFGIHFSGFFICLLACLHE